MFDPQLQTWNPSRWVLACMSCAVASVVFLGFGVAQLVGIVNAHNNFARVRAPGAGYVEIPRGQAHVWLERDPKRTVTAGTMDIRVYSAATREEIPITATRSRETYHTFGRDGRVVGAISIPEKGRYLVVAQGGGGNNVSIGKIATGFLTGWATLWFTLAAVAAIGCCVTGVLAIRARRTTPSHHDDLVSA